MNITTTIRSGAKVTVTPADPLTEVNSTFTFGLDNTTVTLTGATQAYGITGTALSATATIDLVAGTVSGGGTGTINKPLDGKDADGVTINLSYIQYIEVRNTGSVALELTFAGFIDGSVVPLPVGGRFWLAIPTGEALTTATLAISGGTGTGSDVAVLVIGKVAV